MARLVITLDGETYRRLAARALEERRPIPWQAEVLLRDALAGQAPIPSAEQGASENEKGCDKLGEGEA